MQVPLLRPPEFYCPRLFIPNLRNRPHAMPYNWLSGFLGWIWPIIRYQEPDVSSSALHAPSNSHGMQRGRTRKRKFCLPPVVVVTILSL